VNDPGCQTPSPLADIRQMSPTTRRQYGRYWQLSQVVANSVAPAASLMIASHGTSFDLEDARHLSKALNLEGQLPAFADGVGAQQRRHSLDRRVRSIHLRNCSGCRTRTHALRSEHRHPKPVEVLRRPLGERSGGRYLRPYQGRPGTCA
jgi:hypothetical protein